MAKYLIKIPSGLKPWEADNWRAVDAIGKAITLTNNKVDSPISGLAAGGGGKVKINQYDSTAEYLEKKIVESNSTTFVQSNDGLGAKEIKIHSTVIEDTTVPADIIAGELFFDTDARFGTPFIIGDGEAGIKYELKFDGDTNDGSIYWNATTDMFEFADDVTLNETLTVTGATAMAAVSATDVTANAYNIVCYDGDVVTIDDEVLTYA